jgi:hypothetical protein
MKVAWCRKVLIIGLLFLCLLVTLFFLFFRGGERQRVSMCAYDGLKIDPLYEVQFIMKNSEVLRFCSIICALQAFAQARERIESILVTDEVTGQKMNAEKAFFIESSVVTVPHVKNRIHVFASEVDAVRHRDQYSGKHIKKPFSLFSSWREKIIGNRRVRIKIDPITGLTRIIKSDPYITILKDFDLDALNKQGARKALAILISLLGGYLDVEIEDLKFAGMERIGGSWFISFWQTYGGVIIFESSIGFSIDPGGNVPSIGVLLHKAHKALDLPTQAKITLKEAKAIAIAHLMEREPYEYKFVAYQLVIYPMKRGEKVMSYHLAYILNFYYPEEIRATRARAGWVCFVDAVTGEIVDVQHLMVIASCCMPVENEG